MSTNSKLIKYIQDIGAKRARLQKLEAEAGKMKSIKAKNEKKPIERSSSSTSSFSLANNSAILTYIPLTKKETKLMQDRFMLEMLVRFNINCANL